MNDPADRWLVTGGAGFIGSHLVDHLVERGDDVVVLDDLSTGKRENVRRRARLRLGDITDPVAVAAATEGVTGIFHLAAVASVARGNEDWLGTHATNQYGTVAVFAAAAAGRRSGRLLPVVYASSSAVYGDTGGAVAHEGLLPRPLSAYGVDKLGNELHARIGTQLHGIPTLGLRFFNVYGARQDPASPYSGVISIFARRIAGGLPVMLHGGGTQTRDFVHISDVVAHLVAAMDHLRSGAAGGGVINVCTGRSTSIRDLASLLGRLHARTPQIEIGPSRPGDIADSCGDPNLAIATIGARAGISLDQGLVALGDDL